MPPERLLYPPSADIQYGDVRFPAQNQTVLAVDQGGRSWGSYTNGRGGLYANHPKQTF